MSESHFEKLARHITKEYEAEGLSHEKAEEIGRATAAKIGREKYGTAEMTKKSEEGKGDE